jgi:hypothetical protein
MSEMTNEEKLVKRVKAALKGVPRGYEVDGKWDEATWDRAARAAISEMCRRIQ